MNQQYCTFSVADLIFGIEVSRVQEVVRAQRITRVPLAQPEVQGLINLRGQIITAIDLRRRLLLPPRPQGDSTMNVMLQTDDGIVSLTVDEIDDVVEIDQGTLEEPPPTLSAAARELVRCASKQEGRLILLLETDKAINLPNSNN